MNRSLILLLALPLCMQAQTITTFAGNGGNRNSGDGGPATAAAAYYPTAGAFDKAGNFYLADGVGGRSVRRISPSGIITRYAGGCDTCTSPGDGRTATAAAFKNPQALAVDAAGNVYVADNLGSRIRRIDAATGIMSTFAGDGRRGLHGDGGPATAASISGPADICFDRAGNLYIADGMNGRIRKVDPSGIISTVAGTKASALYGGDGGRADTTGIGRPSGVFADKANNLFIAEYNGRVWRVNTKGIISTFAGNGTAGEETDGVPATASMLIASKIAGDDEGNLYISDYNSKVFKVNKAGIISTVAGTSTIGFSGDGGTASNATLNKPSGLAIDSCNNLYIMDTWNFRVRKVELHPSCDHAGKKK